MSAASTFPTSSTNTSTWAAPIDHKTGEKISAAKANNTTTPPLSAASEDMNSPEQQMKQAMEKIQAKLKEFGLATRLVSPDTLPEGVAKFLDEESSSDIDTQMFKIMINRLEEPKTTAAVAPNLQMKLELEKLQLRLKEIKVLSNDPSAKTVTVDAEKFAQLMDAANGAVTMIIGMTLAEGPKYTGPLKDGKPHGKGTLDYPTNFRIGNEPFARIKYEGEFNNGEIQGEGKLFWKNSSACACNQANGSCVQSNVFGILEGNFSKGKASGQMRQTEPDGDIWEGPMVNNQWHGVIHYIGAQNKAQTYVLWENGESIRCGTTEKEAREGKVKDGGCTIM